jgi:hypothetical protein
MLINMNKLINLVIRILMFVHVYREILKLFNLLLDSNRGYWGYLISKARVLFNRYHIIVVQFFMLIIVQMVISCPSSNRNSICFIHRCIHINLSNTCQWSCHPNTNIVVFQMIHNLYLLLEIVEHILPFGIWKPFNSLGRYLLERL